MNIAVLLTFDQSLSKWKKDGHFDREIRYYKALYEKYKIKTTFISYGHKAEKDLISKYHFLSSIQVYEKIQRSNSYLIRVVKSFFIFFFIHKDIKDSSIIKSNQLWGTWVIFFLVWLILSYYNFVLIYLVVWVIS